MNSLNIQKVELPSTPLPYLEEYKILFSGYADIIEKGQKPLKLDKSYLIEAIISPHIHPRLYEKKYKEYMETEVKLSSLPILQRIKICQDPKFQEWLSNQPDIKKVLYLSEEQRQLYETIIEKDSDNGDYTLIQGPNRTPLLSFEGVFVIDAQERLFCANKMKYVIQHSTFVNGGCALGAGTFSTDETGKIKEIRLQSGHYKPSKSILPFLQDYFSKKGVDFSYTALNPKKNKPPPV